MTYTSIDAAWWPFLFILLAGSLPTMIWRWMGAYLVGGLDDDSEWIALARCLSAGLIAAVIAQFVLQPTGALAELPVLLRAGAAIAGFGLFLGTRNLFVSILFGEAVLIGGALILPLL